MANNLAAFIPQIWSTNIVQRLNQINVMLPLVNRDYEGELKAAGDTVFVRTFGDVTLQTYVRGQPLVYDDLSPTKESLVITTSQSFAFAVDDLDTAQNDINALDGYTDRAVVALNNAVEQKLLSKFALAISANQISNSGSAITISTSNPYTTLVQAQAALDAQNVPQQGRWCVVSPIYKSFIVRDSTYFVRATDLGDIIVTSGRVPDAEEAGGYRYRTMNEAQEMGFFGRAAGFDMYMSTALPTDSGGKYCEFGQGFPISYASQIRELEAIRLESTFATAIRGLLLHDCTIFNEHAKKFGTIYIALTQ